MRLTHRLYYAVKPVMPWRLRMAVRRFVARRERDSHRDVWPIREAAGTAPAGWQGWPDARQFAVVLTHDVEGPEGLANVRALAELEMSLGFRSTFNFIPSGNYRVSPELRQWLTQNGFEVGVHDLQHDGRLFQSRESFAAKAREINRHLADWGACGFRAGFMLRNLDWQHQLAIEYDSSTFDTDPFELQSDGANTIFPYWIPRPHAETSTPDGYVELPYTLPQDSTLFLVLGEETPEIWLRKTDWIARRGGMALVNVHPDYVAFSGTQSARQYPASHYETLLRHLRDQHQGKYWHGPARDLARWIRSNRKTGAGSATETGRPPSTQALERYTGLRGKRAAVLLYSEYPADPRPRRSAEAMVAAGMEVDLLCVAGSDDEPAREWVGGVQVTRRPIKRSRDSKLGYLKKYALFIAASFWFLTFRRGRRKYDIVHVHNMPDVLVFSTILAKLGGAKVILDLHDPMPEVMMTIYGLAEQRFPVRLLKKMEKWSIGLADAVITVNIACRRIFSRRSCAAEKVSVIMNAPDEAIFRYCAPPARPVGTERPFVIMYHGSIVERHGLDLAVEALRRLRQSVPRAELRIYGNATPFLRRVMASVENSDLHDSVHFLGPKNLEDIAAAIRDCDVGVIPNRRSIFTELNTPTRIFEYLSQGKPVIAPRAAGILDYFGTDDLVYFELGDVADLAEKLAYVHRSAASVAETVRRGQAIYQTHLWSNERHQFLHVVAATLGLPAASQSAAVSPPLVAVASGP
jgi:glycosyltransferase involved in cell wall biosynthesis